MFGIGLYVLFHSFAILQFNTKDYQAMHCNLQGAPPCCSGAKCNKVGRSDSPMFMCEKESDDQDGDDKCLKPGCMVTPPHYLHQY